MPFLLVSGTIGEGPAVEAMRSGVQDYILKGNLPRLAAAVDRELRVPCVLANSKYQLSGLFVDVGRDLPVEVRADAIA